MFLVVLLIFGCITNYAKARAAQLNAALWSFLTVLAIFIGLFIGSFIVAIIMMIKDPGFLSVMQQHPGDQEFMMKYMSEHHNLLVMELFLLVCGVGGYLFINYLIKKKGVKQEQ